jgi:surface antigen
MRLGLAFAAALGLLVGAALPAAAAVSPPRGGPPVPPGAQVASTARQLDQVRAELGAAQAAVSDLDRRLAASREEVAAADRRTADDLEKERRLQHQIGEVARARYQTQGAQLTGVLEARSVAEMWGVLAEDRLVAEHQKALVGRLEMIRQADQAERDRAWARGQDVQRQLERSQVHLRDLQARATSLTTTVWSAGRVLAGSAGRVPAGRLPQTTGDAGQCTWYAEQAWVAFSDPGSPTLTGDGADVVPNLARSTGRQVELTPQPGSLVSWQRQMFGAYGHVGYVAAVERDGGGALTGYTVWEMNYQGPFVTDARHVDWTGPSGAALFLSPPAPVDPPAAELAMFGPLP